ncbi:MAG: glutamyl-tRNA reductase [Magnetococcales bacterium]|nr:glutamyl-tRNA reductase [Magnetococcales bacterium]
MKIIVVGLSHKTAPVSIREQVAAGNSLEQQLTELVTLEPVSEAVLLSTCNRFEVYFVCDKQDIAITAVQQWLAQSHDIEPENLIPHLYTYQEEKAIDHGFRVAASLDSLVVGEAQILGQLKQAFQTASQCKTTGTILNKLFHRLFQVAKKIRTETGIAKNPVSIASVAVNLARRIFGRLEDHTCLLIGAGEMCELAAQHLSSQGVKILVVNRTLENAQNLAAQFSGEAFTLSHLEEQLARADIILSSTGAEDLMVQADMVKSALKERRQRPQFYIDIAVPRDLDPEISQVDNAFLYDIDDLKQIVEDNMGDRDREMGAAQKIIDSETPVFIQWLSSLAVVPTVIALKKKIETIKDQELGKLQKNLPNLSPDEQKKLEKFARLLVNKILHQPLKNLNSITSEEESRLYVDTVQKLFELAEFKK